MKGIILAGGLGSRLFPITKPISKQLLPIYDKPMIYYPLSVLMLIGIKEIMIISTPEDTPLFQKLLGDGSKIGISLSYKIQANPNGIAEAFIVGEDFIGTSKVALILGDNIFYGQGFIELVRKASKINKGAMIFGYYVRNSESFGVVELDENLKEIISLEEKPPFPKSHYAIPGLYFYDSQVVEFAKSLQRSKRGELEITDLNRAYLERGKLQITLLGRGLSWFDTGTQDGLLEASSFIQVIQKRQGYYVACIEEIAFRLGYIDSKQLYELAKEVSHSDYERYLKNLSVNETIVF